MVLIADSGSSKTDWCLSDRGRESLRLVTKGMNPYFQTGEEMKEELNRVLLPQLNGAAVRAVFFYGAGCTPDKVGGVSCVLQGCFPDVPVWVGSDLLGAARGLCGRESGIACILGTGSNSCFYDGNVIRENVSPLGFILGDEGSGAVLGKLLVGDCLKNRLPSALKEKFLARFQLTAAGIIDRVYRQPFPNRFLASLSLFLHENLEVPEVYELVYRGFTAFFDRNVKQYDYRSYPVHLTGSIAYYYREVVVAAAKDSGVTLGRINRSPMEGLVLFHSKEDDVY